MSTYTLLWLPWIAGLTGLAGWLALRARARGDAVAALRWTGWSLVPVALLMTGSVRLVSRVASEVSSWATHLVFNPLTWIGVALGGVGVAMIGSASALRRRGGSGPGKRATGSVADPGQRRAVRPADPTAKAPERRSGVDDDMAEIEEILRRRGIG